MGFCSISEIIKPNSITNNQQGIFIGRKNLGKIFKPVKSAVNVTMFTLDGYVLHDES